jgi:uncharacterized membrane protein
MRILAYLFESLTALAALGLAWLGWQGAHLRLPMFDTTHPAVYLLASGIVGLTTVFLAITRTARWPLSLWSLAVFAILFRGYFLTAYTFSGPTGFTWAATFTIAALLAFLFSLPPRRLRAMAPA